MKIIIDPIYTQDVNRCASAVKMSTCVTHLLSVYEDVFFYWFVPNTMTDEEKEWLPKSNKILYIPLPYFADRYKEYWHSSDEYRRAISFSGDLWDADMILTNRTTLVPYIKWAMHRPGGSLQWSKLVVLIEDMPIMSFKLFIPQSSPREGDIATLLGYMTATKTFISAYWEKKHIVNIGRKYLSPSSLKYLNETIIEASAKIVQSVGLKTKSDMEPMLTKKRKFTISYAGRMVNRDFVDDSFDIILNNWIMGGDNIRMILCTVSTAFGRITHPAKDLIEVMRPNREEFWRIMREESDVGVFMSRDEDYSMVMMEPLILGTPIVIFRAEHSVASIGADYPFFVDSIAQGYAMVKRFKDDYEAMYAIFSKWSTEKFFKILEERNKDFIPALLCPLIDSWKESLLASSSSLERNEIVQLIATNAPEGIFSIMDVLMDIEKKKLVRSKLTSKAKKQFDNARLTFSTHFDGFRIGLLKLGFVDAGPEAGLMKRG